jgi:hypothetical protein
MDFAVACITIGASPGANSSLNPLNKIEASCLFERTGLDVLEEVADLFVEPKTSVSIALRIYTVQR